MAQLQFSGLGFRQFFCSVFLLHYHNCNLAQSHFMLFMKQVSVLGFVCHLMAPKVLLPPRLIYHKLSKSVLWCLTSPVGTNTAEWA